MTRAILSLVGLSILLAISSNAQVPASATDDAIAESVRREAWRIDLHRKLADAQAAEKRGDQLGFPFLLFMDVLEKLDVALYDSRPRNISPAPESWGSGAGYASDCRFACVTLDGDSLPFER